MVVGKTRVIFSRARASNDSNSRAVLSAPPVNVIITMSALPKPGVRGRNGRRFRAVNGHHGFTETLGLVGVLHKASERR